MTIKLSIDTKVGMILLFIFVIIGLAVLINYLRKNKAEAKVEPEVKPEIRSLTPPAIPPLVKLITTDGFSRNTNLANPSINANDPVTTVVLFYEPNETLINKYNNYSIHLDGYRKIPGRDKFLLMIQMPFLYDSNEHSKKVLDNFRAKSFPIEFSVKSSDFVTYFKSSAGHALSEIMNRGSIQDQNLVLNIYNDQLHLQPAIFKYPLA